MNITVRAALVGLLTAAGASAGLGPGGGPARLSAAAQDARATFAVGTATARRGQKAFGVLKVPAGSDAGYDIPVVVVHGAKPGPVFAVVSGAHGTEYSSIIAVEQLIDAVAPAELSGTLILVPLVNVPSFERIVPHVNPTDNKSMNRFYPAIRRAPRPIARRTS
jgi:predicted deacylase